MIDKPKSDEDTFITNGQKYRARRGGGIQERENGKRNTQFVSNQDQREDEANTQDEAQNFCNQSIPTSQNESSAQ